MLSEHLRAVCLLLLIPLVADKSADECLHVRVDANTDHQIEGQVTEHNVCPCDFFSVCLQAFTVNVISKEELVLHLDHDHLGHKRHWKHNEKKVLESCHEQ